MMSRIADLKKENQELEKQASIKEGIFEADNRRTRALKESLEIQEKILRNERLIKKLQNLDDLEKKRNLEKELQNFQKSGLTALKKRFDLSSLEKKVNDALLSGDKNRAKSGADILNFVNKAGSGQLTVKEIIKEANENFGEFSETAADIAEIFTKYPEILDEIAKEKKFADMFDQVQDTLGLIDLKKTFTFAGALAAAASLAKETAQIRQDLGLSVSESANLATKTTILSKAFSLIGGDGEQIAAFSKAIASEFGSINQLSFSTLKNFGLISLRTGISGDNAAKLAKSIQSIQGGTLETSLNTISTFENLSRAAGVAPKLVLDDIAESTELFAKFAKDGGDNLARAAIEARKLGLNLSAVDKISESILDFESSIEKQLEASVLLGRQLNLDKARELAISGDLEGVLAEVKNQVGGAEQLSRLNVIQRKALADAVGLEVSELSKLAAGQENVNKATAAGLLSVAGQFATFIGIGALLGGILGMLTGGTLTKFMGKGGMQGLKVGAGLGAGAFTIMKGAQSMLPKAQTGGVVRETGMAVVHKGETIAGTQFGGRESNKLLKQILEQNATLMNRLTNRVGDLALSS